MTFYTGGETVTIKRRSATATDAYGNKTYSLTTITVKNVLVGFGNSSEPVEVERDAIDARLTLYFPNGTAIEEGDRFTIRGTEWVKDGNPEVFNPPFDYSAGVVVRVRKREG